MMEFPEFYYNYTVQSSDIDALNHMNNVAYINLINEVAGAHWMTFASKALTDMYVWVARRHEIEYFSACFLGELLRVKTWIGQPKGATWLRYYAVERISDSKIIAQAQTLWVLINLQTERPARITEEVINVFYNQYV